MGIQAPETWAEFEKIVAEIKDQNKVPFAIAGAEGWTLSNYCIVITGTLPVVLQSFWFS